MFGSSMYLSSSGWPWRGSRIMGFERRTTSPESPTTKSVPILRPSRPSRPLSTASETPRPRTAAPEAPTTKSVPILRPSRPSRAISTASETTCLSTPVFTSRLSEQISSYSLAFDMVTPPPPLPPPRPPPPASARPCLPPASPSRSPRKVSSWTWSPSVSRSDVQRQPHREARPLRPALHGDLPAAPPDHPPRYVHPQPPAPTHLASPRTGANQHTGPYPGLGRPPTRPLWS